MKQNFVLAALLGCILFSATTYAQTAATLLTVGTDVTTVGRFDSTYRKNAFNKTPDYSEKALRDYLDLYTKFRLKVQEARTEHLDTTLAVRNELQTYRVQLAKPYLMDKEAEDALVKEAYDRSKEDVHIAHILIRVSIDAKPADTAKAWKKITDALARVRKGEDFATVAREISDDPSVKDNGGDLGWITAFQVGYSFENTAYKTKVGKVSEPFRTKYGYDVMKVIERRPSQGTIKVAHIFSKIPHNATDADKEKAKAKIEDIYAKLKAGGSFDVLAKTMSDDKTTSDSSGKLPAFGTGKMVAAFEQAAFTLKNPGDYSAPVMTPYGWHIIKLIARYPIPSFDDEKEGLRKDVEKDERYQEAKKAFVAKTKKEYNYKEIMSAYDMLLNHMDSTIRTGTFSANNMKDMNDAIFTFTAKSADGKTVLANKAYSQYDFALYMEHNQRHSGLAGSKEEAVSKLYTQYVQNACDEFKISRLEYEYPSFREQMSEYRDGIMLFEITDRNVWTKAIKDTTGLKAYYQTVKGKYLGNEKVHVKTYIYTDSKTAEKAAKMIAKGATDDQLRDKFNKKDAPKSVVIVENNFEKGQDKFVDSLNWKAGTYTKNQKDGSVHVVNILNTTPPQPKPLDEVKGYVVSEYQEVLEKSWIDSLRAKYPVQLNNDAFKTLIK